MPARPKKAQWGAWPLWLVLGILWLGTLPLRSILDPDEGRYAEIPREMIASGDWVTPTLNNLKYFEKPPLQYWATAALYSLFGSSEWTSRLWAAVLGFLSLPLVYGFSRRIGQPRAVALTAAAILAVNPYFGLIGQLNLLDQAFSFFLVGSVFALLLAQLELGSVERQRAWMLLAWAGLAFAVLSKGIVAIALTSATLIIYMLLARDSSPLRRMHFLPGLFIFAAIATPWFAIVQARNPEFAAFFFMHEHFARFLTNIHGRTQPIWYFPALLFAALTPVLWSLKPWFATIRKTEMPPRPINVAWFLMIWCLVVLVFFSASRSKLAPYILPMMAPIALLLAPVVQADARSVNRAGYTLFALAVATCVALNVLSWRKSGVLIPAVVLWTALSVAAGLAAVMVNRFLRGPTYRVATWTMLAAASIVGYQAMLMSYSHLPPTRSAKGLIAQLRAVVGTHTQVFSVGQFRPSIPFYLNRPLDLYAFTGELEFGLREAGNADGRSAQQFMQRWIPSTDAIAFLEPVLYEQLAAAGMPGRIIATDGRSVVVKRR